MIKTENMYEVMIFVCVVKGDRAMTNRDAAWVLKHIEAHNGLADEARKMAIRLLEAADVEGEIIEDGYYGIPDACSNCGAEVKRKHYYCWYCGIKFRNGGKVDNREEKTDE